MQYQVQEMLRIERIFEAAGHRGRARRLQPADPGRQQLEGDAADRVPGRRASGAVALAQLKGVEDRCWVQVAGSSACFAIADEDLERENDEKTSSVHFLRFELTPAMVQAAKRARRSSLGIDHDHYRHAVQPLPEPARAIARRATWR